MFKLWGTNLTNGFWCQRPSQIIVLGKKQTIICSDSCKWIQAPWFAKQVRAEDSTPKENFCFGRDWKKTARVGTGKLGRGLQAVASPRSPEAKKKKDKTNPFMHMAGKEEQVSLVSIAHCGYLTVVWLRPSVVSALTLQLKENTGFACVAMNVKELAEIILLLIIINI